MIAIRSDEALNIPGLFEFRLLDRHHSVIAHDQTDSLDVVCGIRRTDLDQRKDVVVCMCTGRVELNWEALTSFAAAMLEFAATSTRTRLVSVSSFPPRVF